MKKYSGSNGYLRSYSVVGIVLTVIMIFSLLGSPIQAQADNLNPPPAVVLQVQPSESSGVTDTPQPVPPP